MLTPSERHLVNTLADEYHLANSYQGNHMFIETIIEKAYLAGKAARDALPAPQHPDPDPED